LVTIFKTSHKIKRGKTAKQRKKFGKWQGELLKQRIKEEKGKVKKYTLSPEELEKYKG
jgi:hypothetical protein